ncbi:MAG: TonB-dependent receptor [Terracidiphilus sp.]
MMSITRRTWIAQMVSLLLCVMLFSSWAIAQTAKGVISGTVADNSGAVLKGARLELLPLKLVGESNPQGEFTLSNVPEGSYTLSVSYVGFKTTDTKVDVIAGQTKTLEIKLGVASASDEIVVSAERVHGEADSINETRMADNIEQVLPAEVIVSLPNANAADAIGRLPSVSLYRIEGEGVYIQVRGTEPRLSNVTVDGVTIPAPEPYVREVRLDVLPSSMIDAVELNKTLSANIDANGIGGSVNIRTKTAGEQPTIDAFMDGGYTNIMDGRASTSEGVTAGKRFGATKRFGTLLNSAYDYNGRGIDNFQPSLDPLSTFAAPFYDSNTIRDYRYYRYRYGMSGAADLKLSDSTSFFANGIYSDLKDWGDKWYYSPVSQALTSTGTIASTAPVAGNPAFYTSSKRPNASVGTLILGGRHLGSKSWFTAIASASYSYEVDSAGNPKADFSWIGPSLGNTCNFVQGSTDLYHPHFGNCDNTASSPLLVAANWALKDLTTSTGKDSQLNLTAASSYARNYNAGSHFGTFEMGFKFTNGHKAQDATETVYDGWSTKAAAANTAPAYTMTALESGFHNTDYFGGNYFGGNFGPVSDFNKVVNYVLSTPAFAGSVDAVKTAGDTAPNLFDFVEQVTAGYLMNTIDFGKMHIQTGLRFENTQMDTLGHTLCYYKNLAGAQACGLSAYTGSGEQWVVNAVTNNPSYLDVLPDVQLRYAVTPNSALRAVFARGVARPTPYLLVPYVTEDSTKTPVSVSVGNPALRPEHANNYDLLYETSLHPLGMIQAGFFFKQLTAPQLQTSIAGTINVASLPAGSVPAEELQAIANYPGDSINITVNGQNAYLYGFEASYQQHLSFLPGVLSGFGINANYGYSNSLEKGLPLRLDQPRLIDQPTNTWRISPSYDNKRLSARVGFAYDGPSVFQYSYTSPVLVTGADASGLGPTGPSGDIWTLAHYQLDAQASYRIWRGLTAKVVGLNLNNEVFGYYQGSNQFVNQREYYKPTYTGGLRYTFTGER